MNHRLRRTSGVACVLAASCWSVLALAAPFQPESTLDPSAAAAVGGGPAPELPDLTASFIRMLLALGVMCALLFVALWWLRRRGLVRPARPKMMRVVDSLRLGHGREVVLVEVAGRYQLLGVTAERITMLTADPLDSGAIEQRLGEAGGAAASGAASPSSTGPATPSA